MCICMYVFYATICQGLFISQPIHLSMYTHTCICRQIHAYSVSAPAFPGPAPCVPTCLHAPPPPTNICSPTRARAHTHTHPRHPHICEHPPRQVIISVFICACVYAYAQDII